MEELGEFVVTFIPALPGNFSRTQLDSSRTIWHRLVEVFQGRRRLVLRLQPPFVVFAHATPPRFFSHRWYRPRRSVPFPHANLSRLKLPGKSRCVLKRRVTYARCIRIGIRARLREFRRHASVTCVMLRAFESQFRFRGNRWNRRLFFRHDEENHFARRFSILKNPQQSHCFILLLFNSFALFRNK